MMSAITERLEYLLQVALEENDLEAMRPVLDEQYPADIADILERLNEEDRYRVFTMLSSDQAAEVLNEMGAEATRTLLQQLSVEHAGDILDQMEMDDVVEILTEDVPERQEELLAAMEREDAAEVTRLLQYPEDSAGLMMTERYVRATPAMTAQQILDLTRQVNDEVETVTNMYIVDAQGRLLGVTSLREIIMMPPDTPVSTFMETDVISVLPEMDQETVARMVARYDFLAMPVVNEAGKMLGIVTIDDIIDVLVEEQTEDLLSFGGVGRDAVDQPYFTVPLRKVLRSRIGWLLMLMVAATLTDTVMRLFDAQLSAVVALTFFIPMLIGTGGNTGAQTVSTIIRGLAVQDIRFRDIFRVFRRELLSGFLLGITLGLVAGGRVYIWDQDFALALVVGLAIVLICTWANVMGAVIPLVAYRLKLDPALVSAPMITTLVDATGLLIYLSIATLLLDL